MQDVLHDDRYTIDKYNKTCYNIIMKAESLTSTEYYECFERGGWDLSLMYSAMTHLNIPQEVRDSVESVTSATLLVLGSATPRNIHNVAKIDNLLRPGQSQNDGVLMVDYNNYPMKKHLQEWQWLERVVHTEQQEALLPYPDYAFIQANMMQLPIGNATMDTVLSDYTVNFLDDYGDVQKTFAEIARVLKPGGILLLSVAGHENVDPTIPLDVLADTSAQKKSRYGGSYTSQFPQQMYTHAAASSGLALCASRSAGKDLTCAILQKHQRAN